MNNKLKQIVREEVVKLTEDINDFKKALEAHDWYYMMSDSSRVYDAGVASEKSLRAMAKDLGSAGVNLYNKFHKKHFPKSSYTLK